MVAEEHAHGPVAAPLHHGVRVDGRGDVVLDPCAAQVVRIRFGIPIAALAMSHTFWKSPRQVRLGSLLRPRWVLTVVRFSGTSHRDVQHAGRLAL